MSGTANRNQLLAALPPEEYRRLKPSLTETTLEHHKLLEDGSEPITHVYFPWGGVCSLTATMSDGRMVEVGTIGNEGLVGMAAYFGGRLPNTKTMVQVPGEGADVMRVRTFVAEMEKEGPLYRLVRRYSHALLALMSQSVACNALHDINQRCARWLLMTHDRMDQQDFNLSHEFLAVMLGVQRPTVSIVAGTLQEAGLIRYSHGRISVCDRKGLEAASCECYGIVRAHFDRLRDKRTAR
jgi:CRP-like cAMP-binding protein